MKNLPSLLLLLTALVLSNCTSTPMQFSPVAGGERVHLVAHRIAVTLPNGWRIAKNAPGNTQLFAATDNGQLRFVINGPLGEKDAVSKAALVANPTYQQGIQQALKGRSFSRIDRSGMIPLAGVNAFRCEASTSDKSQSIQQIHFPYNNRIWVASFYSTHLPVSKVADVSKILLSLELGR